MRDTLKTYRWRQIRKEILARDGGVCHYCGAPANTVDHVIARKFGGDNSPSNLVAACRSCNSSKQDRPMPKHRTRLPGPMEVTPHPGPFSKETP